jgi:hypothetical protein
MAKWFGPPGDCGCQVCFCESNGGFYPGFDGVPTVRIIVSGLPSVVGPFHRWRQVAGIWFRDRYFIRNLHLANGTYFWTLGKEGAKCIKRQLYGFQETFTVRLEERIITEGSTQCGKISTTDNLSLLTMTLTDTGADGDNFGLRISVGGTVFGMLGQIEFSGPNFDMAESLASNTLGLSSFPALTWPRSSGDIKLRRIALAANTCGIIAEDASGLVEGTVGTITAEIIDL